MKRGREEEERERERGGFMEEWRRESKVKEGKEGWRKKGRGGIG